MSMTETVSKRATLIIASITAFITPFMGSSINIALPALERALDANAVLLSWVATAYLLAVAVSLVPSGRMADIYGRKKIFTTGIIIFSFFSLLSGFSMSVSMLIFLRVFQGIGGAMIFATSIAILTSVFPPQERGKALGINVAAVYTGLSLGPFLGGLLTQYLTWRSVFWIHVPLGLVVILLVFWKLKGEWAESRGERFDRIGTLIYAVSIIAMGISLLSALKGFWLLIFGLGIIGMILFVKVELRISNPVFDLRLFSTNRLFAFSSLAALINYSATFAVTFLLSLYLQQVRGLNPQAAGLILVSQPVMMVLCSPFAGRLSDRIEPRIVASIGMTATTLSLLIFLFLDERSSFFFIIMNLAFLGVGLALFSSPNTNAIMGSVERRFYGLASGAVGTMRTLGMMISMCITALVFTLFLGPVQITPEHFRAFMRSFRMAFIIFSLLCLGGIFSSLIRGSLRENNRPGR
ncbi:MAG: MFS transporter [Deltaproteobacteria bacterium]|nr:MFS transporter [Deltaproteobacteria bacterium]